MKCEEFESLGLDAGRDGALTHLDRAAAREHAATCPQCAALQESWQTARLELRAYAEETAGAQTPDRLEMRLRHEFRAQHRLGKARRTAVMVAWALAAVVVLASAVSWKSWRGTRRDNDANSPQSLSNASLPPESTNNSGTNNEAVPRTQVAPDEKHSARNNKSGTLVAENDLHGFTLLPGSVPAELDDAAILLVRMQRGALGAFGLPVNEERAAEWIQVELLVGNDGLPQAVKLQE